MSIPFVYCIPLLTLFCLKCFILKFFLKLLCFKFARLKQLMASALRQLNDIWGGGRGWNHPLKISGTTKGMNMKFLQDVGIYKEAQNPTFFDIKGPVCKLQSKLPRKQFWKYNF